MSLPIVPAEYMLAVTAIVGNEETAGERQKNFLTEAVNPDGSTTPR